MTVTPVVEIQHITEDDRPAMLVLEGVCPECGAGLASEPRYEVVTRAYEVVDGTVRHEEPEARVVAPCSACAWFFCAWVCPDDGRPHAIRLTRVTVELHGRACHRRDDDSSNASSSGAAEEGDDR